MDWLLIDSITSPTCMLALVEAVTCMKSFDISPSKSNTLMGRMLMPRDTPVAKVTSLQRALDTTCCSDVVDDVEVVVGTSNNTRVSSSLKISA